VDVRRVDADAEDMVLCQTLTLLSQVKPSRDT
jgi:hypothetical protein